MTSQCESCEYQRGGGQTSCFGVVFSLVNVVSVWCWLVCAFRVDVSDVDLKENKVKCGMAGGAADMVLHRCVRCDALFWICGMVGIDEGVVDGEKLWQETGMRWGEPPTAAAGQGIGRLLQAEHINCQEALLGQ
eukprot:2628646-Amphidinium_carterae.1